MMGEMALRYPRNSLVVSTGAYDNSAGILVDPDDPAAVAAAVNELLANPERRRQLGAAGRKAVEAYYNWDRVVADLNRIDAAYRLPDRPAAR
jgi:glycosyltransferase involved in cell wall biosynthesis